MARPPVTMADASQHLRPQIRILFGSATTLGPGKARVLETIAETGSISATARELGMSYRRCWMLVDSLNRCFCEPVITTATGGANGGGAALTGFGREIIRRYRDIEVKAAHSVRSDIDALCALMTAPED
ncbi:MAG: LysR family transcriptional regulator [Alphaproteobacteria bacterium]|nr:LysR family transcriptional regulator [Alphaproteobacteria bacterium]